MTNPTPPSIVELIRNVTNAAEADVSFAVAATLNLYQEILRRVHGRVLLKPEDVQNVLKIVDMMLSADITQEYTHTGRKREPDEKELEQVLEGKTEEVKRRV